MSIEILTGNCLKILENLGTEKVQCCITSPPYWKLRDYGNNKQLGQEETIELYINNLVKVFDKLKPVLKSNGTLWVNIGDKYYQQQLMGIPWLLAFALKGSGWILRQEIIWNKTNPMPESTKNRCTRSHEFLFMFSKQNKYYYDNESIKEDAKWAHDRRAGQGRIVYSGKRLGQEGTGQEGFTKIVDKANKRSVWTLGVNHCKEAHTATFPISLVEPCIKSCSKKGDTILDIFAGSGTVAFAAHELERNSIMIDINEEYTDIIKNKKNKLGLNKDMKWSMGRVKRIVK
jgi:DNA modification methylase